MSVADDLGNAVSQFYQEVPEELDEKRLLILVKVVPHPKEPFLLKLKRHVPTSQ